MRRPSFAVFLLGCIAVPLAAAALVAGLGYAGVAALAQAPAADESQAPPSVRPTTQPTSRPTTRPGEDAEFRVPVGPPDTAAYGALLARHVGDDGLVDYEALARDRGILDRYVAALGNVDLQAMGDDDRLATLINAYNAMMLQLVLDEWPVEDVVEDIDQPFEKARWTLAGEGVSLNDIEHDRVRGNYDEPRIHWALVCGAFSCPKLRSEAYRGDRLEEQLADQAEYVHGGPRYYRYDGGETIEVTSLYDWYADDFMDGDVLEYAAQYDPRLRQRLDAGNPPEVKFIDYSWAVNDVKNRDRLPAD